MSDRRTPADVLAVAALVASAVTVAWLILSFLGSAVPISSPVARIPGAGCAAGRMSARTRARTVC